MLCEVLVCSDNLSTVTQLTLQIIHQRLGSRVVLQLGVIRCLLFSIESGQGFCLLSIVNDTLVDIVSDQVILSSGKYPIQSPHLSFKEFNDIIGLAITQLLILCGKHFIQDIQRVVGNTGVVGRVANVNDIAIVQLNDFQSACNIVNTEVGVVIQESEQIVVLHGFLIGFQFGISILLAIVVDKGFDLSRN